MSGLEKKISFIKSWYNHECTKLSFSDRLKLARVWTDICLRDEEYEMAATIREEKIKMIKAHIKEKRSKRSFLNRAYILFYLLKRRVKIKISSIL